MHENSGKLNLVRFLVIHKEKWRPEMRPKPVNYKRKADVHLLDRTV